MLTSMLAYEQTPRVAVRGQINPSQGRARLRYVGYNQYASLSGVDSKLSKDKTRTTLTMDDLSAALGEYGINARKPEFYM